MAPLIQDDTIPFGQELEDPKKLPHPYVTLCHVGFRSAAILTYLLCGWFSDSFITNFVFVVLLLSIDFWTVKNITGRLMVGLRWWNYIDDAGVSHWVFESRKNRINPSESRIFWIALIAGPVLWSLFFLIALLSFKFKWLLLVTIAEALNGANLYGYVKCKFGSGDKGIKESLSSVSSGFFREQVLQNMTSIVMGSTFPQQPPQPGMNPQQNII